MLFRSRDVPCTLAGPEISLSTRARRRALQRRCGTPRCTILRTANRPDRRDALRRKSSASVRKTDRVESSTRTPSTEWFSPRPSQPKMACRRQCSTVGQGDEITTTQPRRAWRGTFDLLEILDASPGGRDLAVRDFALVDRKSTRLNSSHSQQSRMPSSA